MTSLLLGSLFEDWIKQGSPEQDSFPWRKTSSSWQNALPQYREFIDSLPASISRGVVREFFDSDAILPDQKFVASMIWGYGDVGYGPHRVSKMVSSSGFLECLLDVEAKCRNGAHTEAYLMLQRAKISQLGPSFASKYLYFLCPTEPGTPILDSLVGKWLASHASDDFGTYNLKIDRWDASLYGHWIEWSREQAKLLGTSAGQIELLIFNSL